MNENWNLPDGVLACDLSDGIDWDEAFERHCEREDDKAKIEREDELNETPRP